MTTCVHHVTEGFCLDCLRARIAELEGALNEARRSLRYIANRKRDASESFEEAYYEMRGFANSRANAAAAILAPAPGADALPCKGRHTFDPSWMGGTACTGCGAPAPSAAPATKEET